MIALGLGSNLVETSCRFQVTRKIDKGKRIKVGGVGRRLKNKRQEARGKRQATILSGFDGFL
jgi:hypothetical protein